MATLKEHLVAEGVKREIAMLMDEIVSAVWHRVTRFKKTGVERYHILIDMGRYRGPIQRIVQRPQDHIRMLDDIGQAIAQFDSGLRLVEEAGYLRFNRKTAEYELTDALRPFYEF